jgi:hypothetical protein
MKSFTKRKGNFKNLKTQDKVERTPEITPICFDGSFNVSNGLLDTAIPLLEKALFYQDFGETNNVLDRLFFWSSTGEPTFWRRLHRYFSRRDGSPPCDDSLKRALAVLYGMRNYFRGEGTPKTKTFYFTEKRKKK